VSGQDYVDFITGKRLAADPIRVQAIELGCKCVPWKGHDDDCPNHFGFWPECPVCLGTGEDGNPGDPGCVRCDGRGVVRW